VGRFQHVNAAAQKCIKAVAGCRLDETDQHVAAKAPQRGYRRQTNSQLKPARIRARRQSTLQSRSKPGSHRSVGHPGFDAARVTRDQLVLQDDAAPGLAALAADAFGQQLRGEAAEIFCRPVSDCLDPTKVTRIALQNGFFG